MSNILNKYSNVNGANLRNSADSLYTSFDTSQIREIKNSVSSNLRWKAKSKQNLVQAIGEVLELYNELKKDFITMKAIGNKITRYNEIVKEINELQNQINELERKILYETDNTTKKMYRNQLRTKKSKKTSKMNYLYTLSREINNYKNKIK